MSSTPVLWGKHRRYIASFETKSLVPLGRQVERIKAIRKSSDSLGIPLFINARTDAFHFAAAGDEKMGLDEAIRRAKAYAEA